MFLAQITFWSLVPQALAAETKTVRVLVWDEQQPQQRMAYSNFLGNEIAAYLRNKSGIQVLSTRLADPEQGLPDKVLDQTEIGRAHV